MKIHKIEQNVEIPTVHSRFKFPWAAMEIDDSVFVEPEEGQTLFALKRKVGPSARYYGEKTCKKFKTLIDRENNGIRVWRLTDPGRTGGTGSKIETEPKNRRTGGTGAKIKPGPKKR